MAYENIPLNWEMLAMLGAVGVTAAGGAWKISQLISGRHISDRQMRYNRAEGRAETAEREAEKLRRRMDDVSGRLTDRERIAEALQADLAAVHAQPQNQQITGHPLKTIEELESRIAKYDKLRSALFGAEDEVWKLRGTAPPADFHTRMLE